MSKPKTEQLQSTKPAPERTPDRLGSLHVNPKTAPPPPAYTPPPPPAVQPGDPVPPPLPSGSFEIGKVPRAPGDPSALPSGSFGILAL